MSTRVSSKGMSQVAFIGASILTFKVFLLTVLPAHADDASCAENEKTGLVSNKASVVVTQLAPICYGVKEEQHPLSQEVFALMDKDSTPASLSSALRTLAMRVQTSTVYGAQATRDKFAESAEAAAADVDDGVAAGTGKAARVAWEVNNGTVAAVPGLNITGMLDSSCTTVGAQTTQACKDAIESAKAWLRAVQLADAALSRYSAPAIQAELARSTVRLGMWHAYRDEALPQFPWEWLLNSWRLDRADRGPNGRPRDANGQPKGPMKVPNDQIILLHPGIGLEYRNEPDKQPVAGNTESKTAPIMYLELLGRYRWSWDESTGKMLGGNGISIVATYADRQEDTEVGYGLMFHSRFSKTYTFGITRSGDSTNIVFNVDLAEFFKDKLSYWKGVEAKAAQ